MTLQQAFEIIMDLAIDNAIDHKDAEENALTGEYLRQQEAFALAHKIFDLIGE